ncbi:hypothetical protein IEU95_01745 [Hoyosella rhizosphaerae]|nr:hypothetical protein [Hoyosella rhizosphaerae]MBN4925538.1 hypothetical protein [Hoyosella rhizosphaerae]
MERRSIRKAWPLWLVTAMIVVAGLIVGVSCAVGLGDTNTPTAAPTTGDTSAPNTETAETRHTVAFGIPYVDRLNRIVERPANAEGEPLQQQRSDWSPGDPVVFDDVMLQETKYGVLPFSAKHGPWEISECRAEGYSRTPMGAVIAALHLDFRWSGCRSETAHRELAETQIIASESELDERLAVPRDQLEQYLARVIEGSAPEAVRVISFRPDFVTFEAAIPGPSSLWGVARVTVVWKDGGWKYLPSRATTQDHISDISGWVRLQ